MTIRDIAISFGYEVDKNSEKKANDSIDKLKSVASKALGAIAIVFSIKGLSSLAEAAANAEALESQFSQVFGNMEDKASTVLNDIAKETGVLAGRMKGSFAQIAAFAKTSGMQSEDALNLTERAMRAVADSAAFYDRSLEDVTGSLQSFLKGNFANDAALGLSATETTRNTAANALYGKSFKDLAEDQKQLTLLQMVEDANKLSGALGQAARESDTWGNQLGNLKQSVKDLQVAAGSAFLKPAIQVLKLVSQLVGYATKAIKGMTAEGRLLNRVFESFNNGIKRAQVFVENFVNRIGGAENAFKLLALAAASLFIAMNAGPILSFVKNLIKGLNLASLKMIAVAAIVALVILAVDDFINFMKGNDSVIGEIFKAWGIDADGFRDKVVETWNKIKDTLSQKWEEIKTSLSDTWENIKSKATEIWDSLKLFWSEHGDEILLSLSTAWENIKETLSNTWDIIKLLAEGVFGALLLFWETWGDDIVLFFTGTIENVTGLFRGITDFISGVFSGDWEKAWQGIKEIASGLWDEIVLVFTTAKDMIGDAFDLLYEKLGPWAALIAGIVAAIVAYNAVLTIQTALTKGAAIAQGIMTAAQKLLNAAMAANPIGLIIAVIAALVAAFITLWNNNEDFRNFFINCWNAIKDFFTGLWEGITDFFKGIWEGITAFITSAGETINGIFTAIGDFFKGIWEGIKTFFQGVWDFLVGIVKTYIAIWQAVFQAVGDFFQAIWNAIVGFFQGVWDTISGAVTAAGETLKAVFTAVGDFFRGIWDGIVSFFSGIWDTIVGAVTSAGDTIKGIFTAVGDFFKGIWEGVSGFFGGIWDGIVGMVQGAMDKVMGFIQPILDTIGKVKDAVGGVIDGAKNVVGGAVDKVKGFLGFAKGTESTPDTFVAGENGPELIAGAQGRKVFTADKTNGILGAINGAVQMAANVVGAARSALSEPKEVDVNVNAPQGNNGVSEAIKGIGSMISSSFKFLSEKLPQMKEAADNGGLTDAIKAFGTDIASLAKSATASPATVQSMVSSTTNRSVMQNNYFENTFNGERAAQQRTKSVVEKNSSDATGQLARALAYAR